MESNKTTVMYKQEFIHLFLMLAQNEEWIRINNDSALEQHHIDRINKIYGMLTTVSVKKYLK